MSKENIRIPYEAAHSAVRSQVAETLTSVPGVLAGMMDSLSRSQGKNIRGSLTALAACDAEGTTDLTAVKIAAAIEILHLASLVHDDVIDDSDTRRGSPSLHALYGKKNAVMAGDYLFCLSFSLISEAYSSRESAVYIDRISDFSKVIGLLCLGEIRQNEHRFDTDLDLRNYLRIIGGKTAALFALSMYTGARSAGLDHQESKIYGRIGGYFGIIFQLIDDCLDYDGDREKVEKPVGKDLREGIITLPFIYAAKKEPAIKELFSQGPPADDLIEQAISRICGLGGTRYTKELAAKYRCKALKHIDTLEDGFKKEELAIMLDLIYDRQK